MSLNELKQFRAELDILIEVLEHEKQAETTSQDK